MPRKRRSFIAEEDMVERVVKDRKELFESANQSYEARTNEAKEDTETTGKWKI